MQMTPVQRDKVEELKANGFCLFGRFNQAATLIRHTDGYRAELEHVYPDGSLHSERLALFAAQQSGEPLKYMACYMVGEMRSVITSIWAYSLEEAEERLEQELKKVGRYHFFRRWEANGRMIDVSVE